MKRIIAFITGVLVLQMMVHGQVTVPDFQVQLTRPAYQEEIRVNVKGVKLVGEANYLPIGSFVAAKSYVDGLGRPLQDINRGGGSLAKPDIVSFTVYDKYGRESRLYLPYAANTNRAYQATAVADQTAFYSAGAGGKYAKDAAPYSEVLYDNSPMNAEVKIGGAGTEWQLSTNKVQSRISRTNTVADQVRKFANDGSSNGFFPAGTLLVSELTDEDGNKSVVFADQSGDILLSRKKVDETIQDTYVEFKDTYTIYSEAGLPVIGLPPNVVQKMKGNGWILSPADLNSNCFQYRYDTEGRQIAKKVPSSGWTNLIYDNLNRLVMVQTALQAEVKAWYFFKYDKLGRKIMEGVLKDNVRTTAIQMQQYANTYNYLDTNVTYHERAGTTLFNYTDICFPQSSGGFASFEPLSVYYYDSYDIDNNGTPDFSYIPQSLGQDEPELTTPHGSLAVHTTKKLGGTEWIRKVFFYGVNGKMVQQQSNSLKNSNVTDIQHNVFDFAGKPKRTIRKKTINSTSHVTDETFAYDQASRLLSVNHKYGNNTVVTIAEYQYNAIGQLVDKNLGKLGPNSFLQSVDFKYNIKGWLVAINNEGLTNDGYNEETNDLFGMELLYNTTSDIGNSQLFNGHVSGVKWRVKANTHLFNNKGRAYTFSYDKLGQLRQALFKGNNGAGWNYLNDAFSEKNIQYDLNGNITQLERNMLNTATNTVTAMDKLSYTYLSGGDQLKTVVDANGTGGMYGFKNQSTDTEHYLYDANGNVIRDKNRNIQYSYNILGKLEKVTFLSFTNRYIQYTYLGDGSYVARQVFDNGASVKQTDYLDAFVTENNALSYVSMQEGRLRFAGGNVVYEYFIQDHLGNVRVSFENQGGVAVVRQENSFYPFGLVHNTSVLPTDMNKGIYEEGYWENDFGNEPDIVKLPNREYDPVLGRFNNVDPMVEKYASFSAYNYCLNDPVYFTDPSGADPIPEEQWGDWWNDVLNQAENSPNGGRWVSDGKGGGNFYYYKDELEAFLNGTSDRFSKMGGQEYYMAFEAAKYAYYNLYGGEDTRIADMLPPVVSIGRSNNGNWVTTNESSLISQLEGNGFVFNKGSRVLEWVQTGLDVLGSTEIPIISWIGDLGSGIISATQGDWAGAGMSFAAIIVPGMSQTKLVSKWTKRIATGFQRHHVIPNQIYRKFKKELKNVNWYQNHTENLKRLPTPFHGNHPAYNKYVRERIDNLDGITLDKMKKLQFDLRQEINDIYLNNPNFERLNDYYKALGY